MTRGGIQPAFREPARESQSVFRTVMEAMARPGRILPLSAGFTPPAPLGAAAAAILLTLADFETPVWLDGSLSRQEDVTGFLRFHTGARFVDRPGAAVFALIADSANAPPIASFAQGAPDYPDQSTTVVFQVETLSGQGWIFAGPGINGEIAFGAAPLPADFTAQLTDNRAHFPLGVDMIFAGRDAIAALPRSTRLVEAR
jgi:alpha-D-ribose 1-methylphosphonate 5-triphosphate synthase subunit PhnH